MRRRGFAIAAALVCVSVSVAVLVLTHFTGEDHTTSSRQCLTGVIHSNGRGCWMRGDIDGDGHEDAVAVVHRRLAKGKERDFLVAKTRNETLRIWVADWADPALDGPPYLAALAPIDTVAGAELIVENWSSASSNGYSLYTVRDQRLARIRIPDRNFDPLRTGGSIGSGGDNHVNCPYGSSRGVLISGGQYFYWPGRRRVDVKRQLWRFEGTRLVLMRGFSKSYSRGLVPERIPGFPVLKPWEEFAGCGVYPGGKRL